MEEVPMNNYLSMFVDEAKKYWVRYTILPSGSIGYISLTAIGVDRRPDSVLEFGSKAAYDWLMQCIKEEGAE